MIASASNCIYRISLEEGKFLSPFESVSNEINCVDYNDNLNILLSGGN